MSTLRSVSEVAAIVTAAMSSEYRIVVGIAGPPGAGKSTIAEQLVDLLHPAAALMPLDGFHLPQAQLAALGRRDRMGAPDTFDLESFRATLVSVRRGFGNSGHPVAAPGFDRAVEEPIPHAIDVSPEFPCVVVEGNYLLLDSGGWERTAAMFDLSFYVELADDVRHARLIARHERYGKSPEDATRWALGPDEANARLVEATARRADYRIALG